MQGKCSIPFMIIVSVIFLVVAAILFPCFAPRCNGARKAFCLNNLKHCAQALKMYADDYNGQLPSSYLVSHSKTWDRADYRIFGQTLGKFPPDEKTRRVTWSQILYDHMKRPEIMFCPSDTVDKSDPLSHTSYWYKLANDKAWYGKGCRAPRRSRVDYAFEADQMAFYEHCGWHFGDNSGRLTNGLQINNVYMDTHVETIMIQNATSGDPINCAANSDGEPMYYNTGVDSKTGIAKKHAGPATLTDPTWCYDSL